MTRRLVIVGAGYTGMRLAARAVADGYHVRATTRSAERAAELAAVGASPLMWSTTDGVGALSLDADCDVVFSVPTTDDITPHDIAAMAAACRRFVYLSSSSVYGDHGGALIDEDSPRNPTSGAGMARMVIEDALVESGHDALVLRIVGIYGPGRTLDRYIAGGRYKLVDGGQKLTNRIHVDDLVTTILAALDRAPRGPRAYLVADGEPQKVVTLVDWLVEHRGIARPPDVSLEQLRRERGEDAAERWANTYAASNRRIVEELGVELAYPTVFDGYRVIFG